MGLELRAHPEKSNFLVVPNGGMDRLAIIYPSLSSAESAAKQGISEGSLLLIPGKSRMSHSYGFRLYGLSRNVYGETFISPEYMHLACDRLRDR